MLNEKIYGFKHSKHREAILDVLSKSDNPLTAQELHEKIGVSIPTVYRILEQLCEKGIVAKRAILDSKTSSYEISGHRHNAVCLGCKKIKPLNHKVNGFIFTDFINFRATYLQGERGRPLRYNGCAHHDR